MSARNIKIIKLSLLESIIKKRNRPSRPLARQFIFASLEWTALHIDMNITHNPFGAIYLHPENSFPPLVPAAALINPTGQIVIFSRR